MKAFVVVCVAASALAGCASMGSGMGGGAPPQAVAREQFQYAPASDRQVTVSVEHVLLAGSREFIPSDPNWLQIRLVVANRGTKVIHLADVKEQLTTGEVLRSAQGVEVFKAPSFVRSGVTDMGVGGVGVVAGTLLFPPAALVGGAYMVLKPMWDMDQAQKRMDRLTQSNLPRDAIAPGTSVSGNVYVPAVVGQTGLIIFYEVDGKTQTLVLPRVSQ